MNSTTHEVLDIDPFSRTTTMVETFSQKTKDMKCISFVDSETKVVVGMLGQTRQQIKWDMREIPVEPNERLVVTRLVTTRFVLNHPLKSKTEFIIKCLPGFDELDKPESDLATSEWVIGANGHISFSGSPRGSDEERRRGPLPPDSLIYSQELNNIREQLGRIVEHTA